MNEVLVSGGVNPALPQPWLPVSDASRNKVCDWLAAHHLSNIVLMHAHASPRWQSKRWSHFLEMAKALELRGYQVVWVGAGTDAPGNRELASVVGVDATNLFSINELAELGRHARFALTNDSGPMHVLSCSGIPIYAFFGPTNPVQSHALGQQSRVLTPPVPCSPCCLPECPKEKQHACLALLSVETVLKRLAGDGLIEPHANVM